MKRFLFYFVPLMMVYIFEGFTPTGLWIAEKISGLKIRPLVSGSNIVLPHGGSKNKHGGPLTMSDHVGSANRATLKEPRWNGKGKYRSLVRVEPRNIGARTRDEMPARIHISREDLRGIVGTTGKIDVASLQVGQYNPDTGQPIKYGKWFYAGTDWEVPYRWYDDSIPEDFPEVVGNINPGTGELKFVPQRNWGYLNETLGEWDGGNLAWTHTQQANKPSYYAIYFDLLPEGSQPDELPRTGFVGDGTERVEETGASTHGLFLSRGEVADWNGDGLTDILVGGSRGNVIWYPNRGTKEKPSFPYPKQMFTADGKPLDVGFSATPLVIDWDGDNVSDLVCGAEWNRVVWYKNTGTNAAPKLVYKGLVYADDKPLELPHEPVPEIKSIYKADYHPVLAAADINGDGRPDLLAGGYITGRIYFFENMGRSGEQTPVLSFRGPLEADGQPLDVAWCAAPAIADVDGDGLLDIVSGTMPMTAEGGDSASSDFLYLFRNVGTKTEPRFAKQKFPSSGEFPVRSLAAPRLVDLNNDGLLDLVVVISKDLSIYYNIGTKTSPVWEYAAPLPGKWHDAPLWSSWDLSTQLMDWNGDNHFDIVEGFTVRLNMNKGNPQFFSKPQGFIGTEKIFHKSPTGDQWTFKYVADVDGDGKQDILCGVHEGWVYLHRNLSSGEQVKFDTKGLRLNTEDSNPIKVGPIPTQNWDFDILQGARTTLAATDFDHDGKVDLVINDNYGILRYYRNQTGGPNPTFALPLVIAKLSGSVVPTPTITDWNEDGWPDILAQSGQVLNIVMNKGKQEGSRFLPAKALIESNQKAGLYLPYASVVNSVDWNEDGDVDLMATASYGYQCWYERSFLEHGYAPASRISIRAR